MNEIITIEKGDTETIYVVRDIKKHSYHYAHSLYGPSLVFVEAVAVKRKREDKNPRRSGGWGIKTPEL